MKNKISLSIGLLLITIAMVFLFSATGVIAPEVSKVLISWQFLIIALGAIKLLYGHWISASVLLLTGSYFMIPKACLVLGMEPLYDKHTLLMIFLAVLLLVIGLWVIFHKNRKIELKEYRHFGRDFRDHWSKNPNGLPTIDCVFGEISHTAIEKPFKGAQMSVVFGGGKLDLQKTVLQEGDTTIHLACVFGGIQIIVPPDFVVISRVTPIFGGISDKRDVRQNLNDNRRLIVQGDVVFGGVEILNGIEEPLETDPTEQETEEDVLESISVKQNNKVHIIPVQDIQYIQSDGDYVTICSTQGKFLKDQTMKYFQSVLPNDRFLRIHRSYIVNLSEISSIDTKGKEIYFVILKDGTTLRASSGGYQTLKQKLDL